MEVNRIYEILSYISSLFAIIPFILGLKNKKHLKLELKILWVLITLAIIFDSLGYFFILYVKASNLKILNVYVILETILILFFYQITIRNKYWKIVIISFVVLFTIYAVNNLFSNQIKSLDGIILTTESVSITLLSIITFHYILKLQEHKNILNNPVFWINSAFLLFFSGNLFIHLFSQYLQDYAQKALYELWGFHSVLNIILYSLISIGLWKTKKSQI